MLRLAAAVLLVGVIPVGCGDDDAGPESDAGPHDAGSGPVDTGPGFDAGPIPDAGPRPDAGPIPDAGPRPDGAPVSMPCTATGACDPFDTASCPMGQVCLPAPDAGTSCVMGVMTPGTEGAACMFNNSCGPGLICLDFGDGLKCQRMCPDGSIGFCGPGELRCSGTFGDACIHVCRPRSPPCDIYAQDCADPMNACTFVFDAETDAPYTGCRAAGMRGDGETCGMGMGACQRGLVCIRTGMTTACHHVCRPMGDPMCPAGQMCTGLARTWMVNYCE